MGPLKQFRFGRLPPKACKPPTRILLRAMRASGRRAPSSSRTASKIRARARPAGTKALKKGDSGIREIATMLGVGTGTVQRIKAEMSALNAAKRYCRPARIVLLRRWRRRGQREPPCARGRRRRRLARPWYWPRFRGAFSWSSFLTWTEELQASWTARAQAGRSGAPAGSTRDLSQPRFGGAFSCPESPILRKKPRLRARALNDRRAGMLGIYAAWGGPEAAAPAGFDTARPKRRATFNEIPRCSTLPLRPDVLYFGAGRLRRGLDPCSTIRFASGRNGIPATALDWVSSPERMRLFQSYGYGRPFIST
jgi:hypothetical protein